MEREERSEKVGPTSFESRGREREREPKTQPEKPSSVGVRPLAGESEAEHEGVMATPEASCKVNVHQVCTQVECTQRIKGSPGRSIPWV